MLVSSLTSTSLLLTPDLDGANGVTKYGLIGDVFAEKKTVDHGLLSNQNFQWR